MGGPETCISYREEGEQKKMFEHASRRRVVWGNQEDQKKKWEGEQERLKVRHEPSI